MGGRKACFQKSHIEKAHREVLVLLRNGFLVGIWLENDTARAAGKYVIHVAVHTAVHHEDDLFARFVQDLPVLLIAREHVFVHLFG